jgi:acetolactate synthase-1/2/3 large subunit
MQAKQFTGTGARILVDTLARFGVKRLSCVAGESYLSVLDALLDYPEIQVITCRQEGGAAFMAESWGKLTGKPGICFVTRGPGACNASIGVHTAKQDSTPMILFMGQVRRHERGREAFQEIDVRQVFGGLAKWATEIDDPARIPEILHRAFTVATSGRMGPVVIGLPEDMLRETVETAVSAPYKPVEAVLASGAPYSIGNMLADAKRPVVLLGGTGWDDQACADIEAFAAANELPVIASFRRQDVFDNSHACYVGELGTGPNPRLLEKVRESDLVLAIGARLNEIATQGYTLFDVPMMKQELIHIYPDSDELDKVYTPAFALHADVASAARALSSLKVKPSWGAWRQELRGLYEAWTAIDTKSLPRWNGADMTAIFAWLRDNLPKDAIVTTDAGNFSGWAQRYLRYGRPGRLLAPTSGAMGYGVPAAIGASLAEPGRLTLGLCGDGGFMMTGQELATAMHHGAKPIILICNNNQYGTILMHQEKNYPGRPSATALTNPDFVKLAESYGAHAARVAHADDFPAAWAAARAADRLAVVEIAMDPRQITTTAKLA